MTTPHSITGFSCFAGIGGFELGFQKANVPVTWVGFSEINPYSESIYRYHFNHPNYGDITTIDTSTLPEFDLLTGGFPCQTFSSIGNHRGFDDQRGAVFFDLARIIAARRPKHFLLENVKGLLSHNRGRTFRQIIRTLTELRYSVEWQVLDSAAFGVPQGRERVYLVGHRGGIPSRKVFPFEVGVSQPARRTKAGAKKTSIAVAVRSPGRTDVRHNLRFKQPDEPMFTLLLAGRHGIFDGERIHRLTPTESERLQGFPDGFTRLGKSRDGTIKPISDFRRFHALSNAVTTNVIAAIATRLFPNFSNAS